MTYARKTKRNSGGMVAIAGGSMVFGIILWLNTGPASPQSDLPTGAFATQHELKLPGPPEVIYDALTGDISGWWDHSFSESPAKLYIEPRPGGGFYEIFDESGDGVLHATVIAAQRGKLLRFDGPLGFSGKAFKLVTSYELEAVGTDSTRLKVSSRGVGELEQGWAAAVDQVWRHFMFEQFKPYVESEKHLR